MEVVLRNRNGFTIIELLIAMALFAYLLITMLYGYIFAYRLSFENLLKAESARVGQEVLENLRNTPYDSIVEKCVPCDPNSNNNGCKYQRQIRNANVNFGIQIGVIPDQNNYRVKRVTITVCTKYVDHKGSPIGYVLNSIITKKD